MSEFNKNQLQSTNQIQRVVAGVDLSKADARLSAFGVSRFVVGSSRARIPQLRQKVSARASRMMRDANTCCKNR